MELLKLQIDWPVIKRVMRAGGVLVIRNVLVALLILDKKDYWEIGLLLLCGMAAVV
jgi:hypothetical protein